MIKNNDKSKPYSHPRWNDKQLPVVTGHIEFSEEEKEKNRKEFLDYLRKKGYKVKRTTYYLKHFAEMQGAFLMLFCSFAAVKHKK